MVRELRHLLDGRADQAADGTVWRPRPAEVVTAARRAYRGCWSPRMATPGRGRALYRATIRITCRHHTERAKALAALALLLLRAQQARGAFVSASAVTARWPAPTPASPRR